MGKAYTRFQTKTTQEPYEMGLQKPIKLILGSIPLPGYCLFHLLDEHDYSRVWPTYRHFKMSKEGPTVYKTPMLTCFSQRLRIQPFNTVLFLLRIARNDFGKFGLQ